MKKLARGVIVSLLLAFAATAHAQTSDTSMTGRITHRMGVDGTPGAADSVSGSHGRAFRDIPYLLFVLRLTSLRPPSRPARFPPPRSIIHLCPPP